MSSRRRGWLISAWLPALLLAFVALLAVPAFAAPAGGGAAQQAAPAPAPAALELGNEHRAIPLAANSRYWIDPSHRENADWVEAAGDSLPWALRDPRQGYDLDGRSLWVQFDAVTRGSQRWFLEVGSSGIDRAQLFFRGPDGQWVVQEAGDVRPVSDWPLPGRLPTFELSRRTDKPVRYWLRVEHDRVDFASPLVVADQSTLLSSRETEQFLLGGYFSLAALIMLVSIANAAAFRDRNFAAYAVYVGALAAGQLAYLGVGAQHVWDSWLRWNELSTFVLPGVSGAAALWFAKVVTEPARYSRALDLAVWAVIAALLSAVALDVALGSRLSFHLAMTLTAMALVVVALLIVVVWTKGEDSHIRIIALGFLPVLVMALFPLARAFNFIPVSFFTRYGVTIGAAMEMPVLFYALSLRGSRRREAQLRAAALSRNDALTGLAHTRTFLQRLNVSLARCAQLKHACALLAVKIANYDAIIAEYGRDTAERALVVATSLLRNVITDMDMAARVGDHQFAVLLEGPATTQAATSRAQQLVASGLRPSEGLPQGLVLKFQVVVALLPDRSLDADGSLRWLVDAVNSAPPEARKLIRPLNF